MDMFKVMKEAVAMRSKLSEMDKLLKEKVFEVETRGIKIKVNAKSEVINVKISPEVLKQPVEKVEKDMLAAVQDALGKSHEIMTEEAKKITGGMKIPGLM